MRSAFGSMGFKLSQVSPSSLYNRHVFWWALRAKFQIRLCAMEEALIAGEPPGLAGLGFWPAHGQAQGRPQRLTLKYDGGEYAAHQSLKCRPPPGRLEDDHQQVHHAPPLNLHESCQFQSAQR